MEHPKMHWRMWLAAVVAVLMTSVFSEGAKSASPPLPDTLLYMSESQSSLLTLAGGRGGLAKVKGLPDLIPWKLKIDVGEPCNFSFELTIKNKGDTDAGSYIVDVGIIRDGVSLFGFPIFVDGTEAHKKTVVGSSVGIPGSGIVQIAIRVNRFNPIPESDFTNNSFTSRPFACPPS